LNLLADSQLMYAAGLWEIDPVRRELRVRGRQVPIGSRAFEIVDALAQAAGQLVTKDALLRRVWPGMSSVTAHCACTYPQSARRSGRTEPCSTRHPAVAIAC
jgi:DNA-binding response OmpR family regulator